MSCSDTYLWPNSWATTIPRTSPMSSVMAQFLSVVHTVPTYANPTKPQPPSPLVHKSYLYTQTDAVVDAVFNLMFC